MAEEGSETVPARAEGSVVRRESGGGRAAARRGYGSRGKDEKMARAYVIIPLITFEESFYGKNKSRKTR